MAGKRAWISLLGFKEPVRVNRADVTALQLKTPKEIDPVYLQYKCRGCKRWRRFNDGGTDTILCDACWCARHPQECQ